MQLPVQQSGDLSQRSPRDVRAMALAIQANLVHLKVVESKRRGLRSERHEIKVPAPGFVREFRETLLDPAVLAGYPDDHLVLRLREIWGQFCLMLWLFSYADPPESADFSELSAEAEMRCGPVLDVKHDELHAILWLLRFEQRRRQDPEYVRSIEFGEHERVARKIPGQAFGKPVAQCSEIELLHAACEYAGMLAAARWVMGRVRNWGEEGSMAVEDRPF